MSANRRDRRASSIAALAVLAFLVSASAALGAGPSYVSLGGLGVLAPDGKTRYVAVAGTSETAIERVRVSDGSVLTWTTLGGIWGIPAPTVSPTGGEGVTRDGKKVVVASAGGGWPTRFAVLDARSHAHARHVRPRRQLRVRRDVTRRLDAVPRPARGSGERRPLRRARVRPGEPSPAAGPDRRQDAAELGHGRLAPSRARRAATVAGSTRCTSGPAAIRSSTRSTPSPASRTAPGFRGRATRRALASIRLTLGRRRQDARDALARRQVVADDEHRDVAAHARRRRTAFPWSWVAAAWARCIALGACLVLLARRRRPREAAPVPL